MYLIERKDYDKIFGVKILIIRGISMKKYTKSMIALLMAGAFLASCGAETVKLTGDGDPDTDQTVQDDQTQNDPGNIDGSDTDGGNQGGTDDPSENGGEDPNGSFVVGPSADTLRINEVLYENSVYRFGAEKAYNFIEL